jgi:hypothetical protein
LAKVNSIFPSYIKAFASLLFIAPAKSFSAYFINWILSGTIFPAKNRGDKAHICVKTSHIFRS